MPAELAALGGSWIIWCALHSLLAWPSLVDSIQRRMGRWQSAYRLFYNLFALISLVPVALLFEKSAGPMLVAWPEWLRPLLWVMRGLALCLLLAGARSYPLREFAGFPLPSGSEARQVRGLATDGLLGYVRHPWYLAGLLLLWSRDLAGRDLVTALLLSAYLWLGSVLEERRLTAAFGDDYRHYQSAVPRFLPSFRRRQ